MLPKLKKMETILTAVISAIVGFSGAFFTRTSKKEENNLNADNFTFKSLQSENQRLYKQVETLLKDKEMLLQQIEVQQVAFQAQIEDLENKVRNYQNRGEELQKELDELKEKVVN